MVVLAAGAAHTEFDLRAPTAASSFPPEKLHGLLKTALRFFNPEQMEKLSKLWMPVGGSAVIMGGTLHGCELAEFLTKRGRKVVIAHDGPASPNWARA